MNEKIIIAIIEVIIFGTIITFALWRIGEILMGLFKVTNTKSKELKIDGDALFSIMYKNAQRTEALEWEKWDKDLTLNVKKMDPGPAPKLFVKPQTHCNACGADLQNHVCTYCGVNSRIKFI